MDNHADVPITLACGFYDNFIGATLDYYLKIKDKNKSPVNLILGPW